MANEDKTMKLPESYHLQHGCHDCRHCMKICNAVEPRESFCAFDVVGEYTYLVWGKWAEGRQVSLTGICDEWEEGQ